MGFNKKRTQWSLDLEKRFGIVSPHKKEDQVQGIYVFRMNDTDKIVYVGSSLNLYGRCAAYHGKPTRPGDHYAHDWAYKHLGEWRFDVLQFTEGLDEPQLHKIEEQVTDMYHPFLNKQSGDRFSDETNKKHGESVSGRNNPMYGKHGDRNPTSKKVLCIELNIVFASQKEAESWLKENGRPKAHSSAISNCCLGKQKKAYGYSWKFI